MATIGNGKVHCPATMSSVEAGVQSVSRRNKWGQLGEILGGVQFPWADSNRRLMMLQRLMFLIMLERQTLINICRIPNTLLCGKAKWSIIEYSVVPCQL